MPEDCKNHICEKGYKNHPLTEEQKASNREKSKIRCRIEHIFGFMTRSMKGITIRSIGITRAWFQIGFMNLAYNMLRYEFLKRPKPYDNALAENFFSILKTECIYRTKIKTFAEARRLIDDYIHFYNHQRIQLKTKLTPLELRSQFVA